MGVIWNFFGLLAGFSTLILLALCISSGLYLLSELAEEFHATSFKISKYLVATILGLHVLLLLDGLPLLESTIGIVSHLCYATMLRNFPYVELMDPSTIASTVLFLLSNGLWLFYFLRTREPLQVIGFFVFCVWSVPCALFITLTVQENSLPQTGGMSTPNSDYTLLGGGSKSGGPDAGKKRSIFIALSDMVIDVFEKLTNSEFFQAMKAVGNKRK
mmetsp:Transcript_17406/g.29401  ORF Transcript_17406/g.29401 Transcript_17406/m.29401 type:complete len:216 (-) Transcript_17406:84-731(-)